MRRFSTLAIVLVIVAGCQPVVAPHKNSAVIQVVVDPPSAAIAAPSTDETSVSARSLPDEPPVGSGPLTVSEAIKLINTGGDSLEMIELSTKIVTLNERLYPAFDEMLNDPNTSEFNQASVLQWLAVMKSDRTRFLNQAINRLKSKNSNLRLAAVDFLGAVGSEREAALVTLMLLDKDSIVQHAAGCALARIGGEREAEVFNLVLHNARRYEEDGMLILSQHMLDIYKKHRDTLQSRKHNDKHR